MKKDFPDLFIKKKKIDKILDFLKQNGLKGQEGSNQFSYCPELSHSCRELKMIFFSCFGEVSLIYTVEIQPTVWVWGCFFVFFVCLGFL